MATETTLKFRTNYRLAVGFLVLGMIFLTSMTIGNSPLIISGWFVLAFFIVAFLKTRTYTIEGGTLKTSYLFGLFPAQYDLKLVKSVKVIEWIPVGRVSGLYTLITLSSQYRRLKTIHVHFEGDKKLRIDGQTLYHQAYVQLIKKLKRK